MRKAFLLGLFSLNLLAIFVFWWLGSSTLFKAGTDEVLIAFGRLAGLLLELCLLVQILLISRTPLIERAFGFDKLNRFHRILGYGLSIFLFVHPLLIIIGYANLGQTTVSHQFVDFYTNWTDVRNAMLGILVLMGAIFVSLPFIRKWLNYESWHVSHLFMYLAIFLFFGHQIQTADVSSGIALYYWYTLNFGIFALILYYRFLQPFILYFRHRFYVEKVEQESPSTFSVYIGGRRMSEFNFETGQYIHLSFLQRELWAPHPFSLSSAPNGKSIRISIKASGDFTSKISKLKVGTKAFLEGPFGKFVERDAKTGKYLLIAGGIGITPIRALVETLESKSKDVVLLYANRKKDDIVFEKELADLGVKQHHFLSHESVPGFHEGYISAEKIQSLVPDFKNRDVYICGPVPMMNALIETFKSLGVPKSQLHYEKFSY
jgi:predicted ferric reductase